MCYDIDDTLYLYVGTVLCVIMCFHVHSVYVGQAVTTRVFGTIVTLGMFTRI